MVVCQAEPHVREPSVAGISEPLSNPICDARDKMACELFKDLLATFLEFFVSELGSNRMVLIIMFDTGVAFVA